MSGNSGSRSMSFSLSLSSRKSEYRYPIGTTDIGTQRPTASETNWLPNLLFVCGSVYLGRHIVGMYRDGSLLHLCRYLLISAAASVTEHIVEPMANLIRELTETMSREKDPIVTREELLLSKLALDRMLDDFAQGNKTMNIPSIDSGRSPPPSLPSSPSSSVTLPSPAPALTPAPSSPSSGLTGFITSSLPSRAMCTS